MYLAIDDDKVPGTIVYRKDMEGSTGLDFLNKIFFLKDGILLTQIRTIAGVDGSTLQNWVKRGWVPNTTNKLYSMDMFARIVIINMLRDTMQLSKISFLLSYINGEAGNKADDIIPESKLYDYICRITDSMLGDESYSDERLRSVIENSIDESDLNPNIPDAKKRLASALEVIVLARYAAIIKAHSDDLFDKLV